MEKLIKKYGDSTVITFSKDDKLMYGIEEGKILGNGVSLRGTCLKNDEPFEYDADLVLLATGRRPNSSLIQNGDVPIGLDETGFVKV